MREKNLKSVPKWKFYTLVDWMNTWMNTQVRYFYFLLYAFNATAIAWKIHNCVSFVKVNTLTLVQ